MTYNKLINLINSHGYTTSPITEDECNFEVYDSNENVIFEIEKHKNSNKSLLFYGFEPIKISTIPATEFDLLVKSIIQNENQWNIQKDFV